MPLKMIGIIIVLVLVTVFAGLNLDNKCNINLIFRQFNSVPIFFSLLMAFIAGMIVMLPFSFKHRNRDDEAKRREAEERRKASMGGSYHHE